MNVIERPQILLIDDETTVLRSTAAILERHGYVVITATSGEDGFARLETLKPDLIITDLAMPGMSGFDVIERLRAHDELKLVPVIVVTARAERENMRHGMDLGADDFITKPFTNEELLHSIHARLERKALLDELDAFAHTVAHDLRSPLGMITGRIELAQMMMQKQDYEKVAHNLTSLQDSAKRLVNIVDEMLLLAGLRRESITTEAIDSAELVNEALLRVEHVLRPANATVSLPDRWPAVVGFAPWLVHVWTNLLSNAAKYGGPDPRIEIKAAALPNGTHARFAVHDHGPGMDAAAQATAFSAFTDVAMRHAKGHGLGLSIVRRIIAKHHGQVGVESAPGKGAEFWFELPCSP
ncbi:sensor histidine kinase [Actomonas aquatica]|uniref:histidine kinase n=1 Tax=Actomonas aquatica TaxID=2866162 RepID=A0ABZ1C751_9BACT|nr:hybrid sensor histidine kinase/response regulator [Opitutus sp. WL0086]WRQ87243.1 hybrid sensor histidine kinase/response regulator [Opitutus sp. WL0086]